MLSLSKHEDARRDCAILILRQAQDEELESSQRGLSGKNWYVNFPFGPGAIA